MVALVLPPLPPDLWFEPLTEAAADRDFAYAVKRQAIGPHVAQRWGWDEALQQRFHAGHFAAKPFQAICHAGAGRIGTLSLQALPGSLRFGEFYLADGWRGRGIGGRILAQVQAEAGAAGVPVRLEVLLWNPARHLYRRHGWVETARTATHLQMEWPWRGP